MSIEAGWIPARASLGRNDEGARLLSMVWGEKVFSVGSSGEKPAGVVNRAIDSRDGSERNFVERLNLDWAVTVHEPKTGENIVNVVNAVSGDHAAVVLNLNAARSVADNHTDRGWSAAEIDHGEC